MGSAMNFLSIAGEYVSEKNISANISNVYNNVNVTIENANSITQNEMRAAIFMNDLGSVNDPINRIMNTDYTVGPSALPERFSLDINNQLPSDPYSNKTRYLASEKRPLELL